MAQRIGSTIFTWDPDMMTIPESKKTVSRVATYAGSAIFQWSDFIEGTEITLKWDLMPAAQYSALRSKYLTTDTYEWNPGLSGGETYNVKIIDMSGSYVEVLHDDIAYRKDVVIVLDIRSKGSTTTTTSSTTTTTTTTTA